MPKNFASRLTSRYCAPVGFFLNPHALSPTPSFERTVEGVLRGGLLQMACCRIFPPITPKRCDRRSGMAVGYVASADLQHQSPLAKERSVRREQRVSWIVNACRP